jgi:hypothetical protein
MTQGMENKLGSSNKSTSKIANKEYVFNVIRGVVREVVSVPGTLDVIKDRNMSMRDFSQV